MPTTRQRGPAGFTLRRDEIGMLEALLRRTLPAGTTRSDDAKAHRKLWRELAAWQKDYGSSTITGQTNRF